MTCTIINGTIKNKVLKSLRKMPVAEQKKFAALVVDLEAEQNEEDSIIMEVYYAGSRENAPY